MTAFFDTSAIIALADPAATNHIWSLQQFTTRQALGPIIISDIIYAELSAGFPSKAAVDGIVTQFGFQRALRNDQALFDAGQRFTKYKHSDGGPKFNVLSDFFIGAAARQLNVPLVTANPKDFRGFFKGLVIVHPGGQEMVS